MLILIVVFIPVLVLLQVLCIKLTLTSSCIALRPLGSLLKKKFGTLFIFFKRI